MTITIRASTEDDWEILKTLRLAALADAPTAFGVTHASALAFTEQQWRDRAAGRGPAEYFYAFDGDEPAGMIAGVPEGEGTFGLIAMWVRPASRGSGAAGRLVETIRQRAVERGFARVELSVAPDNLPAARLYQRQGFVFVPRTEPLASHPHITVQYMEWVNPPA
ncbi:GNAT family N-acetyltransferase [Massilia arenosa]|uniref:GNAT family N-acetyltransferase n=1 Tax=Zemynaea arenosa TaxID=2561931 RepID=A0A4Y9RX63_9BURK|nr:GNAT family N-acetyltransferase [Massilia arenosa]TFW13867.1 GNAT family N-acetyltransferase [Massilia arenosa]